MSTSVNAETSPAATGTAKPHIGGNEKSRAVKDTVARLVMYLAFGIALVPLVWILGTVLAKGTTTVLDPQWWYDSQIGITARRVGGGAAHAILGTLLQAAVTALIAVPIGIFTAIYLVEYGRGHFARAVSFMVDILTGIPSIVAALFIYAIWVGVFGFRTAGIAVCFALVILMIPTVVRSTEEMLKLVPNELREASYALGVPKWKTIFKIVLPTAFGGIVTGVLLGLARVMGETAPLIILGPYTKGFHFNLMSGNMATLPTMINEDRVEALQPAVDRVWAASLTLIGLILILNLLGRVIARYSKVRN
ncbi:phosphate ABC transporter permease PstA [Mobilicoccus massiliensis]|uniref:phosphate ABC transporter permease PstA n=1 Tax=Mobilicoccus massiliensis TaxID=1522310 RepID=UPI00059065FA|nr:phosphate ABC transporter permease PstA [Mobilicoccus massiliensis]